MKKVEREKEMEKQKQVMEISEITTEAEFKEWKEGVEGNRKLDAEGKYTWLPSK